MIYWVEIDKQVEIIDLFIYLYSGWMRGFNVRISMQWAGIKNWDLNSRYWNVFVFYLINRKWSRHLLTLFQTSENHNKQDLHLKWEHIQTSTDQAKYKDQTAALENNKSSILNSC